MKIEGVAIASLIAEYSVIFFVFYIFYTDKLLKYFDLSDIFDWQTIKGKLVINFDIKKSIFAENCNLNSTLLIYPCFSPVYIFKWSF